MLHSAQHAWRAVGGTCSRARCLPACRTWASTTPRSWQRCRACRSWSSSWLPTQVHARRTRRACVRPSPNALCPLTGSLTHRQCRSHPRHTVFQAERDSERFALYTKKALLDERIGDIEGQLKVCACVRACLWRVWCVCVCVRVCVVCARDGCLAVCQARATPEDEALASRTQLEAPPMREHPSKPHHTPSTRATAAANTTTRARCCLSSRRRRASAWPC